MSLCLSTFAHTCASSCVLPIALDIQEDSISIIAKQDSSQQAEHLWEEVNIITERELNSMTQLKEAFVKEMKP